MTNAFLKASLNMVLKMVMESKQIKTIRYIRVIGKRMSILEREHSSFLMVGGTWGNGKLVK